MKTLTLTIAAVIFSLCISAQVNPNYTPVKGYYKSNGTYVEPHYRTMPNNTNRDNYSTYPNINPWNGKQGTVEPDNNYYQTPSYSLPSNNNFFSNPSYSLPEPKEPKQSDYFSTWPY